MTHLQSWLSTSRNLFLFLLVSADLLFIALGILHVYTPYFASNSFSLERDRGYSEIFQYVKEYWIALLFLVAAIRKTWVYLTWSLLFGYLLLDDSFLVHERLGAAVAESFAFTSLAGLRAVDFGELFVSALVGIVFLLLIGFAYWRNSSTFRAISRRMVQLILALAFVGVALDMVHILVGSVLGDESFFNSLIAIFEDGGELVLMSVICWYVFTWLVEDAGRREPLEGGVAGTAGG